MSGLLPAGAAAALALLTGAAAAAPARLRVVATTLDLADIVRRVGGDRVEVDVLARGKEDIHQVVLRPSFVTKLARADAAAFLGLTLEHSFLPALLEAAGNPRLRADPVTGCAGPGCIDASAGVRVLDKPASLSAAEGEIHPQGNPHYNLDPENGALIARNAAAGLSALSPADAAHFGKNRDEYLRELEARAADWRRRAADLKVLPAVSYHRDVPYLARFTGLDFVGTVELKPGVAPTPGHLAGLVRLMKEKNVRLIVREQQYDAKTCEWLAEKTGARIAVIGTMGGALPGAETFIGLSEANLSALLAAAAELRE